MKPNLGDVIAEKYRLDGVLGEGGMSMVFAAANVLTGKNVAIKWLQPEVVKDEEQSQRLLREAQATSNIDHPNVVNVFDVGRHDGALFLVMELLHGEPLSELLMRGPQDPTEFVRMMMPVLRGVYAAHRVGVVHRDLKPDNIFMCRDPHGEIREPKVLDFGISKLASDNNLLEPGVELTREGTVFGTPQYMAPEQMRDARIADARSDVYALGVIFYRAFSNEYPYDADTLTALAIRIVEGNAAPLHELVPTLDRGLADIVMRALALDPEQRFQSVAELGTALEGYSDGVLFSQSAYERESATWLRRDSTSALLADGTPSLRRLSPPPPPPRTGSGERSLQLDTRSQPLTTALDPNDLIAAAPLHAVSTRSSRLSIPPPPPPTNTRPNRGLEVVLDESYSTQRVDRWSSRRQTLLIGAALFAIGSIAPAGWQLWEKARGSQQQATEQRPRALVSGKGANVIAAIEQQERAKEAAVAKEPAAPPAAPVQAAPAQPAAPVQQAAPAPGSMPSGLSAPAKLERRRAMPVRAETTIAGPSNDSPAAAAPAAPTPTVESLPPSVSERNPYLRR
ncbi:MAG TPA: serine/threonine-protein kinase [Polyangiales bacterium]|nr:serine/threonine-protein kinase [Polyangiales bacterium]